MPCESPPPTSRHATSELLVIFFAVDSARCQQLAAARIEVVLILSEVADEIVAHCGC